MEATSSGRLLRVVAVNAAAAHFTSTPKARNYLNHYYEPSGDLRIPMVALHSSDDPAVPFFHESLYADAVSSAGNAALLKQIVVKRFGHCLLTPFQIVGAWYQLLAQIQD